MASSINASTTAGVVTTADTSAILQLQTAGTTAVTVNASQVVSIGTTNVGGTLNTTTTSGNWGEIIYDLANNASMLAFRNNAGSAAGNISLSSAGATSLLISSVAGVNFPATQVASSDANTLDDYEEGTFTPNVGGTATYSGQAGKYVKVGRIVTCIFDFTIATIGTGSTTTLTGFPFTTGAGVPSTGCVSYYASLSVSPTFIAFYLNDAATTAAFVWNTTGGSTIQNNGAALLASGSRVIGSVSYQTSS